MSVSRKVVIIGAGPAGLMAAEKLSAAGADIHVYDRMPSPARKFLMAGRGGLNLTHSEPLSKFTTRYREAEEWLAPMIEEFSPEDLRGWCEGLGQETFVGTSGRVFPKAMKASPLLRAWLQRLGDAGVKFHFNMTWKGWDQESLSFVDKEGIVSTVKSDALLLALGGASWAKLGSDAAWVSILEDRGIKIRSFRPANCGFNIAWSPIFREKFSGTPVKSVLLKVGDDTVLGEMVITRSGIEGSAVYALSSLIRTEIEQKGKAYLFLDLKPDVSAEDLRQKMGKPKGRDSLSNHLRKAAGLSPVAVGLVQEILHQKKGADPVVVIKNLPLVLTGSSGLERAISSAGGIKREQIDGQSMMLKNLSGVFVAGEMIDWEAPTGGYLLQACYSTAVRASNGILSYLGADSRT
ncbi:MAG: TIGR03862 family flavoprotein [Micavibrio sp.]